MSASFDREQSSRMTLGRRLRALLFGPAAGGPWPPLQARPGLEGLEDRTLLAVALSGGVLTVLGTNQSDEILVSQQDGKITVTGAGPRQEFSAGRVDRIDVYGGGGDDLIDLDNVRIPSVLNGG